MTYHLRYQLRPGTDPVPLARFCVATGIEEVVLMLNAEELHTGHPDAADEAMWFDHAAAVKSVLDAHGVGASLNPWLTTGHADRGRVQELGFAPMVSPTGEVATASASFACPVWQEWLASHYARFSTLGFRILWLEDDFRFHNHAPLTWGGGFEPEMIERFAELAGESPSRDQLVAAISAPGEPHPWRALLQRVWREAQLEALDRVRAAVDGRAKLGLMSSLLGIASVEGRDWSAIFDRVDAHRPHFAPYRDVPGRSLAYSFAMLELQRSLRPERVEVAPEIENFPHTEWTKSDTQTWSEMVAARLTGADALLLDVFPFIAGDPQRYPRVGRMLSKSRPAVDRAAASEITTLGIGVPWWPDTAAHVRGDGTLEGLRVEPLRAAEFLLGYGAPVQGRPAAVNAVFGDTAWGIPDHELLGLFSGGLLLDGGAAAIFRRRGYGHLLGVTVDEVVERHAPTGRPYSLEQIVDTGELLSVNIEARLARLSPAASAETWTHILTPRGEHWGAGRVAYVNEFGGRVVTFAAFTPEELGADDDGRELAHRSLRFLGADLPLVSGGPHLIPHFARRGSRWRIAIANGSADPAEPVVEWGASMSGEVGRVRATLLAPLEQPRELAVNQTEREVRVSRAIPHRGYLLLEWD